MMEDLIAQLPELIEYGGSAANLVLVIILVYVLKKNGSGNKQVQGAVETLGNNHLHHLDENLQEQTKKIDTLVTQSAVQTDILRDIRDSLKN